MPAMPAPPVATSTLSQSYRALLGGSQAPVPFPAGWRVPAVAPMLQAALAEPVAPATVAAAGPGFRGKVFCIGANKTGTSTMERVLRDLGLRVAPQREGELAGMEALRGRFDALKACIDAHDAFQDAPFSIKNTYAQVDALYPGSRFILTWRPADEWFRSLVRYHARIMGGDGPRGAPSAEAVKRLDYLYPGYVADLAEHHWLAAVDDDLQVRTDWSLLYDESHYRALYQRRNRDIVRHFVGRPGDLLVIDVTREPDTRRIVEFLGLPADRVRPMPHENRT